MKIEPVFTGGCNGCVSIGTGSLETVFATEGLNAARVEAFDESFDKDRFDVLVGNEPGMRGQRYRFVVVNALGQTYVDYGVHGTSRVDTRDVPLLSGVSYY